MSYTTIAPLTKAPTSPPANMVSSESNPAGKVTKNSRKATSKSLTKPTQDFSPKMGEKTHRRSRLGCFTCRLRRKKCDEGKIVCKACKNLKLKCEYKRPMWWGNNEQRRIQKELIKDIIKKTKINEKACANANARASSCAHTAPSLSHSAPTIDTFSDGIHGTRAPSAESQFSMEQEFAFPSHDPFDPFGSQLQTPHFEAAAFYGTAPPYEVDIKTERQLYVNDIPTRRDSSISTFSTFQPPLSHATLPTFPGDDWVQEEYFESCKKSFSSPETGDFGFLSVPPEPTIADMLNLDDGDRHLLEHFLENVIRLLFPVLETRQHGIVQSHILPALQTNKPYLHCCLSIAAMHLKSTECNNGDQFDNAILNHRGEAVKELNEALTHDTDNLQILDAILAMILFPCTVGCPNDVLLDIPWHSHFQPVTELITRLELPQMLLDADNHNIPPPFDMTLVAWIDILGSTMLGKTPQCAHVYRTKLLAGSSSGLYDLMGCEDRMMYLISEIACLDTLKLEGRIDDLLLCSHITSLAHQLDHTEPPPGSLVYPTNDTGALQACQLSQNMTALFRLAARVYLCSLVPGFHRTQAGTMRLISDFADLVNLVPGGPDGFDRSLVWPFLICGSFSTPDSAFRSMFERRIEMLGNAAGNGSFGRMVCLLREVWRQADVAADVSFLPTPVSAATTPGGSLSAAAAAAAGAGSDDERNHHHHHHHQKSKLANVHWRDVMKQNNWNFLLI
ncbi:PRO1 protein, variant 1 [Blastomyces gilchristii SLH14081]|uniref:PRO1 protein n=2 Tax=Blastomyces gilchristii (strain SLH14081) TaxID=559298 RepID=A0A179UXQ4_BLAGS|nr:PRO1 protein [Blastomyces gilchristii SLH14081]XP_031580091.1 PRO1 protein, variant 1 [Blastomyces gilchristii SLH14081]OAT11876.1 PRO1 protein [Blastomyces gilchristii SLH14081]OAT11877.1 PRO1 protein, variant 1 [Blastomyces gilchristii SLH14081]